MNTRNSRSQQFNYGDYPQLVTFDLTIDATVQQLRDTRTPPVYKITIYALNTNTGSIWIGSDRERKFPLIADGSLDLDYLDLSQFYVKGTANDLLYGIMILDPTKLK